MILYKNKTDLIAKINSLKKEGKSIGFVPTMGALHQGHLSLIKASLQQNDITICSIFVNPTQFNDANDFNKYPITIENDILQLTEAGANLLFLPNIDEIYPEGKPTEQYNLGNLETIWEGQFRPGHFQGVCQVVQRLFNIVQPDKAYFGQKDYQQCMVIKTLVHLLQLSIQIVIHPTVREASGLALSSRNLRLKDDDKKRAVALYDALTFIKQNRAKTNLDECKEKAQQMIVDAGFEKIDYIAICDAETLQPLQTENSAKPKVALVAAYISCVRLIDNMLL
ncbi:MAG: pantoate--beta-alanine ligase [Bacteroidota bacterium]|nr:pantoate--beta-alanine ligase [Bacteroidota bacterium]